MQASIARGRWIDGTLWIALAACLASCGWALVSAWRWPLVGDAALMRYVVFLLHGGMTPYRDIVDVNLPGSYTLEALAMQLFGSGAIGLRLYDGALCAILCAATVVLSERSWRGRVCGGIAGLLFVLIHLRDGVVQAGQRDLAMAAIALLALVVLLRMKSPMRFAIYELLIGLTLMIKPTLLLLAFLPACAAWLQGERLSRRLVVACIGGLTAPAAVVFCWLWQERAVGAFLRMLGSIERTHSELAQKSLWFLLGHAVGPVAALFLLGFMVWALLQFQASAEWKALALAALCGLASYLLQRKGFPYQRYTFLALALLCLFRLIAVALGSPTSKRYIAVATMALSCFWFAPRLAWRATTFDRGAPFEQALTQDLKTYGVQAGEVQCLDTVGGCIATLNRLGLRQSTGYLYDCYAYVGSDARRDAYRAAMLDAIERAQPRVVVLSSQYCLGEGTDIGRISRWPQLYAFLSRDYSMDTEWQPSRSILWWNQPEWPAGFRLYLRK